MQLDEGKKVFYKTMPEVVLQQATVLSAEGDSIVLAADGMRDVAAGQQVVISADGGQCFAEVVARERGSVRLRKTWSNSRAYFRVEDVVPLVARKVEAHERLCVSRSFPFSEIGIAQADPGPVPDMNPRVWQMLVNIHTMLGMILERLDMETEGLLNAEKTQVNMSATGMAFRTRERFRAGDTLEVRMLLPAKPPLGMIVYGSVIRADDMGGGETEIALQFNDMSEELRNEIVQYSLMRQREIIRKARE
ncbi:MAG: PilZ domain-containing protein [Thermodesulfobacteriota bacterium]